MIFYAERRIISIPTFCLRETDGDGLEACVSINGHKQIFALRREELRGLRDSLNKFLESNNVVL
jgi:hypothetical protein